MANSKPAVKPIKTKAPGNYELAGTKLGARPASGYEVAGTLPAAKPLVPWIKHPREGYSGPTQWVPPQR